MYVVKVGNYYVKSVKHFPTFLSFIELSLDIMRNFDYIEAKNLADKINSVLIPIEEEITLSDKHKETLSELTETARSFSKKHYGRLWASRIDVKYGWKEWCKDSQFRECNINNSFSFKLKKSTRILTINSVEELGKYPKDKKCIDIGTYYCLDFEGLKKSYDAIEINISNDKRLYWDLYGWDCDSILILNKNVIQVMK